MTAHENHEIDQPVTQLRGPAFLSMWEHFAASMHIDLLSPPDQELLHAISHPDQDLVLLGYWREVIDGPVDEIAALAERAMAAVRGSGIPYLVVAGAEPDDSYRSWLKARVPQTTFVVWPGSGHFPHLAHPDAFAEVLASSGSWTSMLPGARP